VLEPNDETHPPSHVFASRASGSRAVLIGVPAVALLCCVLLPVLTFFVGGFLVVAVALHAGSSAMRPFLEPVLRVPVAAPRKRHAHLLLLAGAGLVLLVGGSVGASINGHLRGTIEQRGRVSELEARKLETLLERARRHMAAGELEEAELVLLNAQETVAEGTGGRSEVEALLALVRSSGRP
jgi:hypothetical protein